jgi:DNA helicase HerA-like ATPase
VSLDLDRPHAALIVGKRGTGKSYTLGVIAEEVAAAAQISPVIVDPMGAFSTLDAAPVGARVRDPCITAGAVPPRSWCQLLDLDPAGPVGSLIWQGARERVTLDGMTDHVADADAPPATRRAARNHLERATAWGVFGADALDPRTLTDAPLVIDCAGIGRAATNAVTAAVAETLYAARIAERIETLPWLLVDEAHVCFDGVAGPALRQILTRGRQPGVSLVAATQRPSALPSVAHSQADLLFAHRLTDRTDREALADARPSYMDGTFAERMPTEPGEVLAVDDATESVHHVAIRERQTPHGGESPRASAL